MKLGQLDQENQSERRVFGDIRPIPWASLTIAFCGEFSNHNLQKTQSVVATLEILNYFSATTQRFCKLGISLQLCIQLGMNFQ